MKSLGCFQLKLSLLHSEYNEGVGRWGGEGWGWGGGVGRGGEVGVGRWGGEGWG